MNDYAHDYRLLGVPPYCSLHTLKAARRRLAKHWHPDHFSDQEMKRQAETQIKDINTAYARLLRHYKQFGTLPIPPADLRAHASPATPDAEQTPTPAPTTPPAAASPAPRHRRASTVLRWAAALAAVSLLAKGASVVLNQKEQIARPAGNAPSQLVPRNLSISDILPPPPPSPPPDKYFTIGSTLGEVYAVQGVPTATEDGVWHYGKSKVHFADGAVTSWEENPEDPLKTTMISPPQTTMPHPFTVGSTKEEVRAAEGPPLFHTDTVWDYGLSKVYFSDGRVTNWESSPMHPLKAQK